MDISNWPMDKIMQLPDSAFGTKFSVFISGNANAAATVFFISDFALPDRCVLWEVSIAIREQANISSFHASNVSLKLGTQAITTNAQAAALEDLLTGMNENIGGARFVRGTVLLTRLRLPLSPQGRKVVAVLHNTILLPATMVVGLVFSAIPTEIPDCYAGFPEEKFDEMIRLLRIGVKIR